MTWLLFLIIISGDDGYSMKLGEYSSMEECFDAHDKVIEEFKRPIINYRPVCVARKVEL